MSNVIRLNRALCLMATLLMLPALAWGQDLPSGKEVLDRYIEVTGGREKYANVKSRVSHSTLEIPQAGIKGKLTIYQQAPDKGFIETEIGGIGRVEQGYDGNVAWERSAMMGTRLLEGQEKDAIVRSLTIGSELEPEKYYDKIETVGVENVDDKPAFKVELTSPAGGTETRYYDKESGLIVKTEASQQTQMGQVQVVGTPSEYKDMDGIKMPTKVTQTMMGQTITLAIEKVEHDVEIPAEKLQLPADVKALVEKKQAGEGAGAQTKPKE